MIIANYKITTSDGVNLKEAGEAIAKEQSIGGSDWTFYRDDRDYLTHPHWVEAEPRQAKLVGLDRHTNTVDIGYPIENIGANVPQILNYVAGDAFGSQYIDKMKLLDVEFPRAIVNQFPGPQFGVEGLKERSQVDDDRPFLGVILKPSLGLTVSSLTDLIRCSITAGIDVVKEDEKLASPEYCEFTERLDAIVETLRWMHRETDREVLYVLNVTGNEDTFRQYVAENEIDDVLERFVLLETVISRGFGVLRRFAEMDLNCPMYAHRSGHAAYTRTDHGISMRVFEKLSRLVGADFAHSGAYRGIHGYSQYQAVENKKVLTQQNGVWSDVRPAMPVLSGGITPENIGENIRGVSERGIETDASIHLGGSVYALGETDDDIRKSIIANRQAIEATFAGKSVDEVLQERSERYSEMCEWIRVVEEQS